MTAKQCQKCGGSGCVDIPDPADKYDAIADCPDCNVSGKRKEMKSELKPCPNLDCGSTLWFWSNPLMNQIVCMDCLTRGPSHDLDGQKWNALPRKQPWVKIGKDTIPKGFHVQGHFWDANDPGKTPWMGEYDTSEGRPFGVNPPKFMVYYCFDYEDKTRILFTHYQLIPKQEPPERIIDGKDKDNN